MSDLLITPLAEALLACLEAEISVVDNPPAVVCLRPGDRVEPLLSTVGDECCAGLAWVRVASFYPSANFPDQDTAVSKCGTSRWAAVLEMGAVRCSPIPDKSSIPDCDEWTAVTRAILADGAAMRRALRCCFATATTSRQHVPGAWQPLAVEGGCVGGTMTVTVAANGLDCCDDGSS